MRAGAVVFLACWTAAAGLSLTASAQPTAGPFTSAPPPAPGSSRPLAIDWGTAGRLRQSPVNERGRGVNAKFITANRAAIDQVQIPVLLPGDPDLAANLRFFPNGAFYAVSSRTTGMAFLLTGAGKAFPVPPGTARGLPGGSLAGRIPADGILIEHGESGVDASFSRFGAAYSISLACDNPAADPRCAGDAYIKGVIGRLAVVLPTSRGG